MSLYEKLVAKEEKLSLVGLGYVGMPIAVAFARKVNVIGYDLNAAKIDLYKSGIDPTNEVGSEAIRNTAVEFTADETKLREAKFHIVAVPTPVNPDHTPDLTPVEGASRILGRNLTKGSVVVFESTVYPGVTEEIQDRLQSGTHQPRRQGTSSGDHQEDRLRHGRRNAGGGCPGLRAGGRCGRTPG